MESAYKLVVTLVTISLVVLAFFLLFLPALDRLSKTYLTSITSTVLVLAVFIASGFIIVFKVYQRAVAGAPEPEKKRSIRQRLEYR